MTTHHAPVVDPRHRTWLSHTPSIMEADQMDRDASMAYEPAESLPWNSLSSAAHLIYSALEAPSNSSKLSITRIPTKTEIWCASGHIQIGQSWAGMHSAARAPHHGALLHDMMLEKGLLANTLVAERCAFALSDRESLTLTSGRLAARIVAAYAEAVIDDSFKQAGGEAIDDGLLMSATFEEFDGSAVCVSDDGVLTLEWGQNENGVLVVFTGGGVATFSTRSRDGFYSSLITEFVVSAGLPDQLRAALERITST